MDKKIRVRNGVLGFAIGDAMATPTEFYSRNELLKSPIFDMVPSVEYGTPAGTYSDDTAMTLATMDALIDRGINYKAIADNFVEWLGSGKYTATGKTFDVGNTTLESMWKYRHENLPLKACGGESINDNGNGSLMRMLPLAYYFYYKGTNKDELLEIVDNVSSITHAHEISRLGCLIYVVFVMSLLKGNSKEEALEKVKNYNYRGYSEDSLKYYKRIIKNDITKLYIDDIKSTGFVVDTLESALWIFMKSSDYQEAIIAATNIGGDTDTIAAVTGSLAGIYYGANTFPNKWVNTLLRKDYIEKLCDEFEEKYSK